MSASLDVAVGTTQELFDRPRQILETMLIAPVVAVFLLATVWKVRFTRSKDDANPNTPQTSFSHQTPWPTVLVAE